MMSDKGLKLFDKCAAEFVYTPVPSGGIVYLFFWGDNKMYTPSTIANSQKTPNEINQTGAIANVRILVQQVILEDI